ncbi:MAG: Rrf2 family transcriptional regulator [Acidobacteriota bacterium]|nr:Rrf2 family transcriptional regulator [Acidobacteriota bacterium]
MQITRAADYAVRIMIHMAQQPDGAIVAKTFLAQIADVPESFLSKILQALARAGLVQIRRGVLGGNTLTARGAEASLLEVVEAIDGPVMLNLCMDGQSCHRRMHCSAHEVWIRAQEAMMAVLGAARIAELASEKGKGSDLLTISHATDSGESAHSSIPSDAHHQAVISNAPSSLRGTRRIAHRNPISKG